MITNPGNIVPIYDNLRDQWRFKWGHRAWGILGDLSTLIPFQLKLPSGTNLNTWRLVSVNGGTFHDLDISDLTCDVSADYKYYSWRANSALTGASVACGLYFMEFNNGRGTYYSEVLDLQTLGGYEKAGLSASCTSNQVSVGAYDSIASAISYQSIQQLQSDEVTWTEIGSNSATIPNTSPGPTETIKLRRVVRTTGGAYLTTYYTLYYEVADACGTYVFLEYDQENRFAVPERALLTFSNDTDLEGLAYTATGGYTQKVWLDAYLDTPEMSVEQDTQIDGYGQTAVLSQNTKERTVFEFPKVPDFWLPIFSSLAGLDNKTITYADLPDNDDMLETEFSYRKAEDGYFSVGRLSYMNTQHYNTGCDDNITLSGCP